MASTYDVIIDTPKYHRQGTVKIITEGERAQVVLDVTEVGAVEMEGKVDGKNIDVWGKGHIAGEDVEFKGRINLWANSLDCKAETSMGEVVVYGTRTGHSAGDVAGNDRDFAGRWSDSL